MKKVINKILFVGGGTLGHIFPIVPVVKMLKERNPYIKVYFIGTINGLEKDFIENTQLFNKTYYLDSQGFKRSLSLYNIITLVKYIKTYRQGKKILKEINPDLVIGMGGYISGSVVKAAIKLKIKTVIHEQNSVYGLTNKLLKNKVDLVLLSYDIEQKDNIKLVGNPRISEIYQRYKDKIIDTPERIVLVVGGSRGAKIINDLTISLKKDYEKLNIKVILITGNRYFKENNEQINAVQSDRFTIIAFVKDLSQYLLKARVVVTRCGATTISEVMALRKVCLFIPSPNVTNNHQEKNAMQIVKKEGALMIKESDLTKHSYFSAIIGLLDNTELRKKIINNINLFTDVNACSKFVNQLDELMLK